MNQFAPAALLAYAWQSSLAPRDGLWRQGQTGSCCHLVKVGPQFFPSDTPACRFFNFDRKLGANPPNFQGVVDSTLRESAGVRQLLLGAASDDYCIADIISDDFGAGSFFHGTIYKQSCLVCQGVLCVEHTNKILGAQHHALIPWTT